ncbi:MAG: SIR2 family protein [Oscillospiraceae bacterium]|jgi:putative tetratricopeptide repeat-containing domain protein|nr:SIR2 family protein [Bacillota bacterium]
MKKLGEKHFVSRMHEEYQSDVKFCFILGAGASVSSGIPTGLQMMSQWRDYLLQESKNIPNLIEERAENLGIPEEEYAHIFKLDYELKSEDYFTLYDLRFEGTSNSASTFLEEHMTGKSPSCGYYYLADLLCNTKNRLVITTNFDSLMEDALFISQSTHPLVAGHESLAPLIGNDSRRPVVAKIHRDLLYKPMNRREETQALERSWIQPLSKALSKYIPVVIGYGGGDQSLMSLLQELQLDGIFWCTRGEREKPSEKIQKIIEQHNGYWVPILGFDELLLQIYEKFNQEHMEHENICQKIRSMSEKNCDAFQKSFDKVTQDYDVSRKQVSSAAQSGDISGIVTAIARAEKSDSADNTDADLENELLAIRIALGATQNRGAVALCTDALKRYPNESRIYNLRSTARHHQRDYQAALEDANVAIQLNPNNAQYYNSRGVTLHEMRWLEEALKDKNKAVQLAPNNARYYNSRSMTLHEMKRFGRALEDANQAIQLDPDNAQYYDSRSATLRELKRLEEALEDETKAVQLEPQNALFYRHRALILHALGREEEAQKDEETAKALSSQNDS